MPHDKDSNTCFEDSIYDRVRKDPKRENSTAPRSWSSETWVIDQQLGDTLELVEKVLCYKWSSLQEVKVLGVRNVLLRAWVK